MSFRCRGETVVKRRWEQRSRRIMRESGAGFYEPTFSRENPVAASRLCEHSTTNRSVTRPNHRPAIAIVRRVESSPHYLAYNQPILDLPLIRPGKYSHQTILEERRSRESRINVYQAKFGDKCSNGERQIQSLVHKYIQWASG